MYNQFCKVLLFCVLIPLYGIAQRDSLYTDTVLIVKPPLVIEKKVHISLETREPIHLEKSFELGIYYSVLNNIAPSAYFSTKPFHSYGLRANVKFDNWSIGLGIGMLSSSIQYEPLEKFYTVTTITNSIEKVIVNQYYPDGSLAKSDTFDYVKEIITRDRIKIEGDNYKSSISSLETSLILGYALPLKRWKLAPRLLLSHLYNFEPRSAFWHWKRSLWMVGGEISVCRYFTEHVSTELRFEYKSTFAPFSENIAFRNHLNLLGLGVGVNYKF